MSVINWNNYFQTQQKVMEKEKKKKKKRKKEAPNIRDGSPIHMALVF